jgi:hypothetical protein
VRAVLPFAGADADADTGAALAGPATGVAP